MPDKSKKKGEGNTGYDFRVSQRYVVSAIVVFRRRGPILLIPRAAAVPSTVAQREEATARIYRVE
jgi:hypothetical protein